MIGYLLVILLSSFVCYVYYPTDIGSTVSMVSQPAKQQMQIYNASLFVLVLGTISFIFLWSYKITKHEL